MQLQKYRHTNAFRERQTYECSKRNTKDTNAIREIQNIRVQLDKYRTYGCNYMNSEHTSAIREIHNMSVKRETLNISAQ